MDALVALITPDFHASSWTDQEIGWALGRGVPVIPVRLGADPYGFVGKIQAVTGKLDDQVFLAKNILQALLRNNQVHGHMRRSLVETFEKSNSFATSKAIKDVILTITDFTDNEKDRLRSACLDNNQVSGSWGVPDAIYTAFGHPHPPKVKTENEVPF